MRSLSALCSMIAVIYIGSADTDVPYCRLLLSQAQVVERGILTAEGRKSVIDIFSTTGGTLEQQGIEAFDYYLRERLAKIDPEVAQKVLKISQETQLKQANSAAGPIRRAFINHGNGGDGDRSLMDAHYDSEKEQIQIHTTPPHKNALHTLQIKIHEIEHAIMDQLRKKEGITDADIEKSLKGAESDTWEHVEEKRAMSAEWEFLNSIPEEARLKAIAALEEDKGIHATQKKWLVNNLRWASLPRDEYLKSHFDSGRYSVQAIATNRRALNALVYGGWTLFASLGGGLLLNEKCPKWKKTDPEKYEYIKHFCKFLE